ncbi:hypothetical protein M0R45_015272 [Rubus argutus]|uniref:Uncharacterized protein n=1 Tax=Rubus argutus TaxID=59490 RepID=A0AAW1XPR5_RUBAR
MATTTISNSQQPANSQTTRNHHHHKALPSQTRASNLQSPTNHHDNSHPYQLHGIISPFLPRRAQPHAAPLCPARERPKPEPILRGRTAALPQAGVPSPSKTPPSLSLAPSPVRAALVAPSPTAKSPPPLRPHCLARVSVTAA